MATLTRPALLIMAIIILGAATATAAVIHDPWLARFQVGEFRDPDAMPLTADGWPVGLLAPLVLDPGWQAGAATYFARPRMPRNPQLGSWRLAVPALGGAEPAEEFYRRARRQWALLLGLADRRHPVPARVTAGDGPWTREIRLLHAGRLWEAGAAADAADAAAALVADAARLGLDDATRFAWALRADLLAGRAGGQARPLRLWGALLDLGLYDTRGGWAVWRVRRRVLGAPPLPAEHRDRDAGVMIATAGKLWLEAADLRGLHLPPEVEAGLGALLLPKADLPAHFDRWPEPPKDGRFQGYWLRGKRRLDGSAEAVERLAQRPDLKDGHRLDLWRRASERRLLARQWDAGLADLDRALALMDSDASAGVRNRLREWVVQSLALALADERDGDVQRILELARRRLDRDDHAEFSQDAAALLDLAGQQPPSTDDAFRAPYESAIRNGEAVPLARNDGLTLPDPVAWRDHLWHLWARWGLALGDRQPMKTPPQRAHERRLEAVLACDEPSQRHAMAFAAAANLIRGARAAEPLLEFAVQRDIELLSDGACLPRTTPVPRLLAAAPWRDLDTQWRGHAMLGAALGLGDDRGMLAAAVRLPGAGDDPLVRWSFWYPVPSDPGVREALDGLDLPPEILLAIARNESLFEPAVRSRAGALGYMQIMPFHYADPAGPPGPSHWSHPAASLRAGARILGGEIDRFDGDPYRAVAAYNAGSGAVRRWDKQLGGGASRPLYWAWIGYPETRGYTLRVLRDRAIYRSLLGAGGE